MNRYFQLCAKILCFIGIAAIVMVLFSMLLILFPIIGKNFIYYVYLTEIAMLGGVSAGSWIILRYWEHLPFTELGFAIRGRGKDILWGMLTALILYGIGFGLCIILGSVEVTGVHPNMMPLLNSWIFMLLVALVEEMAIRGFVLGRMLNAGINRFAALFLSSLLFSLLHIFNPGFSFMPFLNILLAGLLLGAFYIYTRNLWYAISLHLFWNWIQGPVLGFQVSGNNFGSTALSLRLPENNLINGGTFGFEGSILCTVLLIMTTALILLYNESKKA